jgi:thiamine-monophosphate kinase
MPGETFAGDDAAVLSPPAGCLLLATDLVVEGVHFDLSIGSVGDAAWKAVSVNVSDIAAMGGTPLHAVVGLSAPGGIDADAIVDALGQAAASYGIGIVGGDLTAGERIVLAVTIAGGCASGGAVLRSGAGVGDDIWVTGPLGGSAAGLEALRAGGAGFPGGSESAGNEPESAGGVTGSAGAGSVRSALADAYLRPVARVAEGRLAAALGATAMIDVSDGLSRDVDHIGCESRVGIRLHSVPLAEGARLEQGLGGGEDYELVFCMPASVDVRDAFALAGLREPFRIGVCVADVGERTLDGSPMPILGWSHSFG